MMLKKQICLYVDYYNTKRLHNSLLYLTTEDYMINWEEESIKMSKVKTARKLFHLNKPTIVFWILIVQVK